VVVARRFVEVIFIHPLREIWPWLRSATDATEAWAGPFVFSLLPLGVVEGSEANTRIETHPQSPHKFARPISPLIDFYLSSPHPTFF
jgi:hypothetical protein